MLSILSCRHSLMPSQIATGPASTWDRRITTFILRMKHDNRLGTRRLWPQPMPARSRKDAVKDFPRSPFGSTCDHFTYPQHATPRRSLPDPSTNKPLLGSASFIPGRYCKTGGWSIFEDSSTDGLGHGFGHGGRSRKTRL